VGIQDLTPDLLMEIQDLTPGLLLVLADGLAVPGLIAIVIAAESVPVSLIRKTVTPPPPACSITALRASLTVPAAARERDLLARQRFRRP